MNYEQAISEVIKSGDFINGRAVDVFRAELEDYMGCHVVTCGNGTDALQIALMALDLERGDEVIVPAFNYISSSEVCLLLGLKPVYCDVFTDFNIDVAKIERLITNKTKVIIPTHLFGLACNMTAIMNIAEKYSLYVIEDNAQSFGAEYKGNKLGTIGHIGTTSFFPTKNLSCFGDGGAIFTKDYNLSKKITAIANHGQNFKYHHEYVGVNSRLDSIQAAILSIKLKNLDNELTRRQKLADVYNSLFWTDLIEGHTYNQYTILIENRDYIRQRMSNITYLYYPMPVYKQKAYLQDVYCENAEAICRKCISLPMNVSENKAVEIAKELINNEPENS
jgi:dTDP-4-amino-4,6-dideoxygalactose transaminase